MNRQGPYYLFPYLSNAFLTLGSGFQGFPKVEIPIVIGTDGLVEVINLTNFGLTVTMQSQGNAYQDARSKCMYKLVGTQGQQMITLAVNLETAPPASFGPGPAINGPYQLPLALENAIGINAFYPVWLNVYEKNEAEWYPPVALSPPPAQQIYFASLAAPGTLILPTTHDVYPAVPLTNGVCYLLGFDTSSNNGATAASSGNLTISNLAQQPDGSTSMIYHLVNTTTAGFSLSIRFPTPIPGNGGGSPITIVLPAVSTASESLIAYYSLT